MSTKIWAASGLAVGATASTLMLAAPAMAQNTTVAPAHSQIVAMAQGHVGYAVPSDHWRHHWRHYRYYHRHFRHFHHFRYYGGGYGGPVYGGGGYGYPSSVNYYPGTVNSPGAGAAFSPGAGAVSSPGAGAIGSNVNTNTLGNVTSVGGVGNVTGSPGAVGGFTNSPLAAGGNIG